MLTVNIFLHCIKIIVVTQFTSNNCQLYNYIIRESAYEEI